MIKRGLKKDNLKVVLIILIIISLNWFAFNLLRELHFQNLKGELRGELGTLHLGPESGITLSVYFYNVSQDNTTLNISVEWVSGSGEIDAIWINISRATENYNCLITADLPSELEKKNYSLDYIECYAPENFTEILDVNALPAVDIIISKIKDLENITSTSHNNISSFFNFSEYFSCNFNLTGDILYLDNQRDIIIEEKSINETGVKLIFDPEENWFGEQGFIFAIECFESGYGSEFTNESFYIKIPEPINQPPVFDNEECGEISWEEDEIYILDLDDCFEDPEDDDLKYDYEEGTNDDKINIDELSGNRLEITPDSGWYGEGEIYVYANDTGGSQIEESGTVEFTVTEEGNGNIGPTPPPSTCGNDVCNSNENCSICEADCGVCSTRGDVFQIIFARPSGDEYTIFLGGNYTFSIGNEDHEEVKWYLDDVLKEEDSTSYLVKDLELGNYTLKVEIKKETQTDSKTWKVIILDDEKGIARGFSLEEIILYSIIAILAILIIMIALILILKSKNKNKLPAIGFGISGLKGQVGKEDHSERLNIQKPRP